METQITSVSLAFPPTKQYAIPSYQRNYVWTREGQWEPLWEDVKALTDQVLAAGPDAKPHFLGTIITKGMGLDSFINRWWVVDGQQRLTTLQILIAAARTAFIEQGLVGYASMLSGLLANEKEFVASPRHKYKIEHKSRDYAGFASIIDAALSATPGDVGESRLDRCYTYFREAVSTWLDSLKEDEVEAHAGAFTTAIREKLQVVDIRLDRKENSHTIFEALNARGEPLTEWEKTKNYILSLAVREDDPDGDQTYQEHLKDYDAKPYWNETVYGTRFTGKRIDLFLFYFAQLEIPRRRQKVSRAADIRTLRRNRLYREFRYVGEHLYRHNRGTEFRGMLERLGCYAEIYKKVDERKEEDFSPYAREVLRRRSVLNLGSLVPVFMELVAKLGRRDELDRALGIVDSYLMRRVALKAMYSGFDDVAFGYVQALRDAPKEEVCAVLIEQLLKSPWRHRWPADEEVSLHLLNNDVYRRNPRLRLLLGGIAERMHRDCESLRAMPFELKSSLTIEHIAPQSWERHWQEDLKFGNGEEDQRRLSQLVHLIGNLTLVSRPLNQLLGNSGWADKVKLLEDDNLEMTQRLLSDMQGKIWNEAEIHRRSKLLAEYVNRIWPHADVLRRKLGITSPSEAGNGEKTGGVTTP